MKNDDLFEDVPFQAAQADDEMFEDVAHPEASAPVAEADPVGDATRGMIGGTLGAGGGAVANKVLEKGVNLVHQNLGDLDASQIAKIDENRELYKKATPLEDIMEQFRTLGEKTRQGGISSAAKARQALEGLPNVPVQEYYKTLSGPAKDPKFSSDIASNKQAELFGAKLDELAPVLNEDRQKMMSIDEELATPFRDERLAINQDIKNAKYDRKIEKLSLPELPFKDEVAGANELQGAKNDGRKLLRIDEKIAKAVKNDNAAKLEEIQKKKQDFLFYQANKKDKTGTVKEVRGEQNKTKVAGKRDDVVYNKILDDEKTAQMKNFKQKERMEKLLEQKAKLESKMQNQVLDAQNSAKADFEGLKNTPKKILDVTPELQNKILGQDYASSLQDAISDVENSSEVSPVRLDQKLQEIRDNVPEGKKNTVGKFNEKLSQALREDLRQRSPEYAAGMDSASESFKTEALLDKNGIRYNPDLDRVTLDDSGKSKINRTLLDPSKNDSSYAYLKEALEDGIRQGNLPPNTTVEDMLRNSEVSALKGEVGRLREGKALNAFDVNSIAKGEASRAPGIIGKMGGTKIQELLALYKNSGAGKAVQAAGKYGLPAAGALAAGMSAANAAESGELSPEAAILSGSAEAFNPLPGLDMVEGAKGGAAGINQALLENSPEELTAAPEFGANDLGAADLVSQNPLAQKALSGFVKGSVAPVGEMAQNAAESFSQLGLARSNDARARMEQNLNVTDSFRKEKAPAPHEEFKNFVEQKPEQIQDLLQLFSNDEKTAMFLAPLEKAANADDRTRSAVLFGLYQQPAFRQALKGKRGM